MPLAKERLEEGDGVKWQICFYEIVNKNNKLTWLLL